MAQQNDDKDTPTRWRLYPWREPCGVRLVPSPAGGMAFAGDPATSTIEPKPEWFEILERWLPEYKPPAQPDRWMLQYVLTREPFNLRPDELDGRLSIENAMVLLGNNEPSEGASGESNRADDLRPSVHQNISDPIANHDLANLAVLKPETISEQMRSALQEAGMAYKKVEKGHSRWWTHRELRSAYPHLPDGKLRKWLDHSGLVNRIEAGANQGKPDSGK